MFYVYEHWRPDTNTCFYVGKGSLRRAWVMANRNSHHKAIQSKLTSMGLAIDVRIIVKNLTEETAFLVERDLINFYGKSNLANMTDGGEGVSNPANETSGKMSTGRKGKPLSSEHKAKLSLAAKGRVYRPISDETRQKLSVRQKARVRNPFSDNAKLKMSLAKRGRPWSESRRQAQGKETS